MAQLCSVPTEQRSTKCDQGRCGGSVVTVDLITGVVRMLDEGVAAGEGAV